MKIWAAIFAAAILGGCNAGISNAPPPAAAPAYEIPAPVLITIRTEIMRPCLSDAPDTPPPKAKGGETLSEKAAAIAEELLRWRRWGAKAAALLQTCR